MAKKERRRAARGPQQQRQQQARGPGMRPPNLRRSATQGAVLTGIYVVVMWIFFRASLPVWWIEATYVLVFFVMYTGFVYFWENYLYRRRQRKLASGGKK